VVARVVAAAAMLVTWGIALYGIATLPSKIPTSFSFSGHVEEYSAKYTLLILPLAGLAAIVMMWWTARRGIYSVNLPFTIPADRVEAVRPLSASAAATISAELCVGFAAIEALLVGSAAAGSLLPAFIWTDAWTIAVFMVATIGTATGYSIAIYRVAIHEGRNCEGRRSAIVDGQVVAMSWNR